MVAHRLPLGYLLWMTDEPPIDPAEHATDFSQRYADDLEIATGEVMLRLGLSNDEMGLRDPSRRLEHHTFFPNERTCGGVSPLGQINVDSGVMNPQVMDAIYGEACGEIWRKTRLRDRLQAIIAHEKAEKEYDGDHELALIAAAETKLPISHAARELLHAMEAGYKGR
jgi:hypothetical protein